MDQLTQALAEAVKVGSQYAYPALMGYFTVRFFTDFLMYPLCWGIAGFTIYKTVLAIIKACIEEDRRR